MLINVYYLAAGNASRFQSNKLLHPYNGMPLYLHGLIALEQCKNISISIYVITRYPEIIKEAMSRGHYVIESDESINGLSYTLKNALKKSDTKDVDYYMFMVGDQPFITSSSIEKLINQTIIHKSKVSSLCYKQDPGNPSCFYKDTYNDFMELQGDQGGRKVFEKHIENRLLVEVEDKNELKDIDTYYDLKTNSA